MTSGDRRGKGDGTPVPPGAVGGSHDLSGLLPKKITEGKTDERPEVGRVQGSTRTDPDGLGTGGGVDQDVSEVGTTPTYRGQTRRAVDRLRLIKRKRNERTRGNKD